jgi:hypothetical protein
MTFVLLLCTVTAAFTPLASAASGSATAVSYGDLMIEDLPKELAGRNQLALSTTYDVSNPYLDVLGAGLTYGREVGTLFSVGVEGLIFRAQDSRYNRSIERDLQPYGVAASNDRPTGEILAFGRAKLLQGRVNALGLQAVPLRLQARVGAGPSFFVDRAAFTAAWGLDLEMFFSSEWGASIRFMQDVERPLAQDSVHRERVGAALIRAF